MSNEDSKAIPTPVTDPLSTIRKAAQLNYSIEQTIAIVCSSFPYQNKEELHQSITTIGTQEYDTYQTGKNIQLFDVEDALYDAAISGDVDALQALLKLQTDKKIDQVINDKFFIDENTEYE